MKVREEYTTCDRCEQKINRHWIKKMVITKFKRRLFLGNYVTHEDLDFCDECIEDFESFMKGSKLEEKTHAIIEEKA